MVYAYRAVYENKVVTGKIEAQTESEAIAFLRKKGYLTVHIAPTGISGLVSLTRYFNRPTRTDITLFTRQLAIMMNAGLTLIDSVDIIKKQLEKQSMIAVLEHIDQTIRSGERFSSALKKHPDLFSNLYISLVEAGEASGKVNEVLEKLAENLEKDREFRTKVKSALIYPTVVIVGMVIVMFVMVTFVLPQLLELYTDLQIQLPLTTRILIAVSSFSARFWPIVIIVSAGGYSVIRSYIRTSAGKLQLDTLLLRLPVISPVIRMASLVDATRTLAILIGSGVAILDGLRIIIETSSNTVFQQAFRELYSQVERGTSLGAAMEKQSEFPPILIQMTNVGEQTGHLDVTLNKISQYFEFEAEYAIKALTSLIEPAIITVLGIGVGILVLSVITPIYTLTNQF